MRQTWPADHGWRSDEVLLRDTQGGVPICEIPHSCYQRTGVTVVTLSSLSSNREVSHIWDMFTPVLPDKPTSTIRDHSNHDRAPCAPPEVTLKTA